MAFPSLYEGFGLPLLEAMACGTPVACSGTSSLPEVGGEAARYFDPVSEASMTEAMRSLLNDEALLQDLAERGLARAARFSWERVAVETESVYRSVLHMG